MADFDSKQKRFSGMGMGCDEAPLLPDTDGSFAQGDRQHFLDLYSGILADSPVVSTLVPRLCLLGVG